LTSAHPETTVSGVALSAISRQHEAGLPFTVDRLPKEMSDNG